MLNYNWNLNKINKKYSCVTVKVHYKSALLLSNAHVVQCFVQVTTYLCIGEQLLSTAPCCWPLCFLSACMLILNDLPMERFIQYTLPH